MLAAATALAATSAASGNRPAARAACFGDIKATVVDGVVRYCGRATARLSRFPGVTFRGGSCNWTTLNGVERLSVYVGQRTLNQKTNGGRPFLLFTMTKNPRRPAYGNVTAYAKRKRWTGVGAKFRVTTRGGTFAAKGSQGSRGRATGSFRC